LTLSLVERASCPVCAAASRATLYRTPFTKPPLRDYLLGFYPGLSVAALARLEGWEYVLEDCSACGLIWQRFAPGDELLGLLYGAWSAGSGGLDRHDNLAYQQASVEEILLVLELVGRRPSEVSILDFGMGWGRWPRIAASLGCRASGVEFDLAAAESARTDGVVVLELDGLPAAAFDYVNSEQVFEHLVDPGDVLVLLARSLAPGGWLKINVPDGRRIRSLIRRPDWRAHKKARNSLNAVAPLEHLNCYGPRSLDALGERGGLRRVRPAARSYYASTVGLWPVGRLARGVARPLARRVHPGAAVFRHRA
jgi:SAM-dependent methyltransferase